MKRCYALAVAFLVFMHGAWCADDLYEQARAAIKAERLSQAEQLLRSQLALHQDDEEARFLLARVLAWQRQYAGSITEYDRLLASAPANSDYLLGKGQVLVWNSLAVEALPLLARARELAPDYEDVWRLEIEALAQSGQPVRAAEMRMLAQQRFPGAQWSAKTAEATPSTAPSVLRSALELGITSEGLSNPYAGWRSAYVEGEHQFGERKTIYGSLRETQRFGLLDNEVQAGVYYPLGETWTSLFEATASPTHNVLARYSALAQVIKKLGYGWNVHAGIRHNEYSTLNSNVSVLTAERYWSNWRAAYSLYTGKPEGGGAASSHVIALDYYYGERSSFGISLADGREVAGLGPLGVLTTDVRALVLRGRHWLTRDWAVSYEGAYQEQGTLYTRRGVRIGLRRAF